MNRRHLLLAAALVAGLGATPAVAADGKVIAGIVFQQDQFFRALQIGMSAAAKTAGYELLEANSESKPDKEQSLINTYISRGVNAIIISPIGEAASAPALQRAKDAGIKVITYNSNVKGDIATAFLNSSQLQIGETTGEAGAKFIKEKLGGKAKIGVLQFKSLLPEQSGDRVNGFLSKVKGEGVEVVADQDAWLAEKAVAVAGDIITANPDINIIFAANEGGTVGAVQAVRNAGKQGKIFVFGTDGSEQIANFLLSDDDVLQAVTAQKPYQMGVDAVNTAIAAIEGKPVEKTIIVPVQGLSRTDPEDVKKFKESLKQFQ
ncbi:MAG: substrate-binding domain-containing protein [Rhizobiales bacterium]|nr:substrate-binding domain-containing protein [Hyphomicrobiales bacterium]